MGRKIKPPFLVQHQRNWQQACGGGMHRLRLRAIFAEKRWGY
jgi:hypothetical protein